MAHESISRKEECIEMGDDSTSIKYYLTLVVLLASGLAPPSLISGAEIKVRIVNNRTNPEHVVVNAGDTVSWVPEGGQSNIQVIESYTGEFKSPVLDSAGASFSFTFESPGLYAYRNIWHTSSRPYMPINLGFDMASTITVVGWTNRPPAVTINSPRDGSRFGWLSEFGDAKNLSEAISILATVTNSPGEIDHIELYAGERLIGFVSDPPYEFVWENAPQGTNILVAKAVGATVSESAPIEVIIEETPAPKLRGTRLLRGGLLAFDYTLPPVRTGVGYFVHEASGLPTGERTKLLRNSGTYISPLSTNQMKFYWIQARF